LHDPNVNRFCMNHPCDGQTDRRTDGIAIAYARLQHTLSRAKIEMNDEMLFMSINANKSLYIRICKNYNRICKSRCTSWS